MASPTSCRPTREPDDIPQILPGDEVIERTRKRCPNCGRALVMSFHSIHWEHSASSSGVEPGVLIEVERIEYYHVRTRDERREHRQRKRPCKVIMSKRIHIIPRCRFFQIRMRRYRRRRVRTVSR